MNVELLLGLAVRVIVDPDGLPAVHPAREPDVQLSPLPTTVPDPLPAVVTVNWYVARKVAVTV